MRRFAGLLAALLGCGAAALSGDVGAQEPIKLADCFGPDAERATRCQLRVAGIHHALTTVQARHGMGQRSCQFPPDLEHGPLVEQVRADLEEYLELAPGLAFGALVTVALTDSTRCTQGVATEPHGPRAAALLGQCRAGLDGDDAALEHCTAYIGGLYDGLTQFSGYEGADQFTCPPRGGQRARDVLRLFIDELKRDMAMQQRPAAEVLALAMARRHPCRSSR